MSIDFTLKQAQALVDSFGGDEETVMTVQESETGHSGPGLYAFCEDVKDEGAIFL